MRKKNITIITGTRAEFGIWQPILRAIQHSKKLNLQLVVTGMHLQKQFGNTRNDIQNSGIPIAAAVPMYKNADTPADSLARATAALAHTYKKINSDLVMLLGDRLEMLAAANAALACQLPTAHLHGGETAPGQWDEQIRHALTKMAHLHFPATKTAAVRIAQMGETPNTIHLVGAPALDTALHFISQNQTTQRPSPRATWAPPALIKVAVLLLHPSSSNVSQEHARTLQLLRALQSANLPFTAIGPNNDPGHQGILRAYRQQKIPLTMNLSQTDFWQLLRKSSLLIGNSSAGIIEAATFGIPVINLGDRQKGRERNPNVIDISWSAGAPGMKLAIHHALTNKTFLTKVAKRKNLYGDGHAAERIVKVLEALPFPIAIAKQFRD